jgi:PIN domain nuclease of toxin-antitoxin system
LHWKNQRFIKNSLLDRPASHQPPARLSSNYALSAAFHHSDPADRFLAATAKVLDLTLVTADQNLLGLGDIATLANR